MIEVSAGIVCREDGKILICQRGEGRKNAHLWEFPGGKREAGETTAQCLTRELREELQLEIEDVQEMCLREESGIRFTFLTARACNEPVLTEHEDVRYVTRREMLSFPFCPADEEVARTLALTAPSLKHFFWDFDGTVMDTYPGMTEIFIRAARSMGIRAQYERVLALMKENLRHCIEVYAGENGVDPDELSRRFRQEEERTGFDDAKAMPGMAEAIQELYRRCGRHYLVTHRDQKALYMLDVCGLKPYFADAVTSEDGFPRKPRPESILHLIRRHGLNPEECVMIGDRPLDTAAGRNAGILSCLFDSERRFPDDPSDLRTDDAAKLVDLLCPCNIF